MNKELWSVISESKFPFKYFRGTREQIDLIIPFVTKGIFYMSKIPKHMYIPLKLESFEILDIDNIDFSGDESLMYASYTSNGVCIKVFSLWQIHGESIEMCSYDDYEMPYNSDIINNLQLFPNFKPFVICPLCKNTGRYSMRDCNMGSSSVCCGGCETEVDCDCETVIFND